MDQQQTRQLITLPAISSLLLLLTIMLSAFANALTSELPAPSQDEFATPQFLLPPNHKSRYKIQKYGSHVGDMEIKLNYNKGIINYSSIATAKGLASFLIKTKPKESSILNWPEDAHLRFPQQQSYHYFQDKKHKKNQQILFSHTQTNETLIEGSYKFKPYTLQTDKTVWARQLIPILMSSDLQLNPDITSNSFYITNKGQIQKYTYTRLSTEYIKFENKVLPVLKFKINREGNGRMSYAWLSSAHFYLPLKIEQYKNDELYLRMRMTHFKLNQDD